MKRLEKSSVFVGYALVSLAFFGWRLLPHPGRVFLGDENARISIWSFAWWPHAIGTWTNPFIAHALYPPAGVNIAWTPSAPGLALLFSPVTSLVGPVASYNLAMILCPAIAAWACYLLCRFVTGSIWGSIVGGYLFGFSAAELRQISPGNLNLACVFVFPLAALLVLRLLRGELSRRGFGWRFGLLFALQLTISTEFAALLTLALAVSLLMAFWLVRDLRAAIRRALLPIAAGYGSAVVIAAPFVYYLLAHFESGTVVNDIKLWGTDMLAPFVPSFVIGLGGHDLPTTLQAHVKSHSAYLGIPTVAIVALFAVRERRRPGSRFLLATFAAAFIATMGATLMVYGHTLLTLPWWTAATHVPALNNLLPFRIAMLEALAVGVITAVWIARTRGRVFARPYVLPVLAVATLVPAVWHPSAFTPIHPERIAFFASGRYRSCIAPGETIAIYPPTDDELIWQAESGIRFDLAQGGIQDHGSRFDDDPVVQDLGANVGIARPTTDRLLAFAGSHGVDRVITVEKDGYLSKQEMSRFGTTETISGVIVAPGCGQPSLKSHDLSRYVAAWESPHPLPSKRNIGWCLRGGTYTQLPDTLVPLAAPGNRVASFVDGTGLTCASPPAGYTHHGFAASTLGVPANTYPYYSR